VSCSVQFAVIFIYLCFSVPNKTISISNFSSDTYLPNLKSVALPVPKVIGVANETWGGSWPRPHSLPPKCYMPTIQTIYLCALVFPRFSIAVLSGGSDPQFWGRGVRKRSGWSSSFQESKKVRVSRDL